MRHPDRFARRGPRRQPVRRQGPCGRAGASPRRGGPRRLGARPPRRVRSARSASPDRRREGRDRRRRRDGSQRERGRPHPGRRAARRPRRSRSADHRADREALQAKRVARLGIARSERRQSSPRRRSGTPCGPNGPACGSIRASSGSGAGGKLDAASGCAARGSEAAAPKSRDGAEDISTRDSWQREAIRGIRSRSAHAARDAVILPAGPSSGPGSQRSRPSWTSARQRPDSACHGRSGPGRHRRGGDPLPTFADPQHGDEGVARRGVRPPAAIPPWRASHAAPPAPDPSAVDRARLTLVERVHQLERPFFEGQTARDAACRPVRVGRRPRTGIGRHGDRTVRRGVIASALRLAHSI